MYLERVIYVGAHALGPFAAALSANGMRDPVGIHDCNMPSLDNLNPLFRGPRIIIRSQAIVQMRSPFFEAIL